MQTIIEIVESLVYAEVKTNNDQYKTLQVVINHDKTGREIVINDPEKLAKFDYYQGHIIEEKLKEIA